VLRRTSDLRVSSMRAVDLGAPAVEDIHQQPVRALEGAPDRLIFQGRPEN
jgi:hypothetical protein